MTEIHKLYSNTTPNVKTSAAESYRRYALGFLEEHYVCYTKGTFYLYDDNCYRVVDEPDIVLHNWFKQQNIMTTHAIVSNTLAEIKAHFYDESRPPVPFWMKESLGKKHGEPAGLIPFKNGILSVNSYLAGKTELIDHSPLLMQVYCLPFEFMEWAKCPRWLQFLQDVFPGDAQSAALLQEWFGYAMTCDVSLQKFMLLVGLPRSGKGTTSHVLRNLVGKDNSIGYDLLRLLDRFAFAALRTKQLAIVPEVELSGHHQRMAILEKLKCLVGNDPMTVERKGVDVTEDCVLPTRWLISCNVMPHLHDVSGALAERMLVLRYDQTFAGREDPHLLTRLLEELPGIAMWALEGLQRLRAKGWTCPERSVVEKMTFRRNASLPLAFLQDCCVVYAPWLNALTKGVEASDTLDETPRPDLFAAFQWWAEEQGHDKANFPYFCKDVRSILPHFGQERQRRKIKEKMVEMFLGVKLNQEWRQRVMVKNYL